MLYNVAVNNGVFMYGNLCAYGRDGDGLIFVSAFGNSTVVQQAVRDLQKKCTVRVHWSHFAIEAKSLEVISSRMQDSDYSHLLLYKKDEQYRSWDGIDSIRLHSFLEIPAGINFGDIFNMQKTGEYPKDLVDSMYDKLLKFSPIPVIKQWVPYILSNATLHDHFKEANVYNSNENQNFKCYYLDIPIIDLQRMLQSALRNKIIDIDGAKTSTFMKEVQGIDAYLGEFTAELTDKIQSSFVPRFVPGEDQYSLDLKSLSDYMNYNDDISLYPAQKDVAQAVAKTFDAGNKCAFVIGECGVGKTSVAITAITAHFKEIEKKLSNKFMTNLIMCPSHLVHVWEREINDRAPRSKAIIIKDFEHLLSLMPSLTGKEKRHEHIWLILSKETAKLGYVLRPAAVWRANKKIPGQRRFGVYCCPHCGKPLFYQTKEGNGRHKRTIDHFLTETSFRSPSVKKNNLQCQNYIQKQEWDTTTGEWKRLTRCDCKLWTVSTRDTLWTGPDDDPTKWIKLGGSAGWIQRCNAERIQEQILAQDDQTADDLQLLAQLQNVINGEVPVQVAPRKFPISKYIRRYLKGKIDYLTLDEIHGYKGSDSLQGEAAGDLIFASKHVLGLTGTLLNGYSSGIYYLLFRMFSKKMRAEGYEYGNDTPFIKDYGVTRQTTWFSQRFGRYDDVSSRGKIKELPGISPIVFTKFLLENAAFLSLEDITEGLPGYEEIPVALDMPSELADAYEDLKQQFDNMFGRADIKAAKCLAQAVQLLSVFPDQPYDQPSVIDPETGNIAIVPPSLTTDYREKETALLEIVERKIAAGEHVLVYYTWTNRSNVAKRLTELLTNQGYKVANLTSQVKAADRETWINKQIENGAQILLCNPTLVETGLTLLDFTTIIYYQYGYNLYTMRQASRRSWRINQDHDVQVYFLYYKDTIQETALALMATKLQAAMAIEGKFSEDGLNAMSNNEDLLTQIAGSVTEGIKDTVDPQVFEKTKIISKRKVEQVRKKTKRTDYTEAPYSSKDRTGFDPAISEFMRGLNLNL